MSTPESRIDDDGHRLVLHPPPTGLLVKVPIDTRASTPDSPQDKRLCKYKGSKCSEPRSRKRNGELHNLCELHRDRAKANQGRFDARLRQRRQLDQADDAVHLPEPIPVSDSSPTQPLDEWEAELLLETFQDKDK